jgi:hypothetical protein
VGNAALRQYVRGMGWEALFHSFFLPEDIIPHLMATAPHHKLQQQQGPTYEILQP